MRPYGSGPPASNPSRSGSASGPALWWGYDSNTCSGLLVLARPREAAVLADAPDHVRDAVPLCEVEFVVVDLETTGGRPPNQGSRRSAR